MKKILKITEVENGVELYVALEGEEIGLMIVGDADDLAMKAGDDPDYLNRLFGRAAMVKARHVMEFCQYISQSETAAEFLKSLRKASGELLKQFVAYQAGDKDEFEPTLAYAEDLVELLFYHEVPLTGQEDAT